MLKLVENEKLKGIWIGDMNDGDVAVITEWSCVSIYLGRIVQRHGNKLITIGMPHNNSWIDAFKNNSLSVNCRVRLLEKGETLIVV